MILGMLVTGLRAQVTQIWRLLDANGVKVPKGGPENTTLSD